jgi:hypothetical protein
VSAGFDLPGGESTAALLRRAEQERDEAHATIRAYVDSAEQLLAERDLARAELASARQEIEQLRARRRRRAGEDEG